MADAGTSSAKRRAGLGFIVVTLFLDILGIGLVVPVVPKLVESFTNGDTSIAAAYLAPLTASYALMQFVFSPVLGVLSDRFGRRPVLLISMAGQGVGYLLLAWAPSLWWLFAGRVIAGITGASIGAATAYIADVSPPEKRAQNFGLIGMCFGLGFIAGPAAGGVLGHISLHLPFIVAAGLTTTNALYGLLVLPESLAVEHRRPIVWGRANSFGALKALGRYPIVLGLTASIFVVSLAQRSLEANWVLYTGHRFGWDLKSTGYSLALVGLTTAIVQGGLVRRVIPALGERRSIMLGFLFGFTAFVLYGFANAGWMMYAIIPVGALAGFAPPALQGLMSKAVPMTEQGLLQGGLVSLNSLSMILGPLIANFSFGYFISDAAPFRLPGVAFLLSAMFMALGLGLTVRVFARNPELPAGEPVSASLS